MLARRVSMRNQHLMRTYAFILLILFTLCVASTFGAPKPKVDRCDRDGDLYFREAKNCPVNGWGFDCNDSDNSIHPGATETCNGVDDNCNDLVDEGDVCGTDPCGDNSCSNGEDCNSCPADCGVCSVCGDGTCDPSEDCSSCPGDCGSCSDFDINSMDAIGDSVSTGVNADISNCTNDNQEWLNWSTSTSSSDFCGGGSDGVLSHAEALQCDLDDSISTPANNAAESGATLLEDFVNQANLAIDHLGSNQGPRYLTLLLGHNDLCSGSINKQNSSCDHPDQDPLNYCRTRPAAFEREFRKGLDQLIQIEDLHIGVASLVRLSQLCNFEGKSQCSTLGWLGGRDCGRLWSRVVNLGGLFGYQSGICGSLTYDCSHDRVVDAYQTADTYREILARVSLEYANLEAGQESPAVQVGGEAVGGVLAAVGVTIAYSDATWYYKFQENELSCCDCFHPSVEGQDKASGMLFGGLECDGTNVCCADGADPYENGLCQSEDTAGTVYPGFFVTGP